MVGNLEWCTCMPLVSLLLCHVPSVVSLSGGREGERERGREGFYKSNFDKHGETGSMS